METHIEEVQSTQRDKGFTLVELLIVIVILGVLATVTVFAVQGITDRGQDSACEADIKTVEVAVEAYYAKNNAYPTALSDMTTSPNQFLKSEPSTVTLGSYGAVSGTGVCA